MHIQQREFILKRTFPVETREKGQRYANWFPSQHLWLEVARMHELAGRNIGSTEHDMVGRFQGQAIIHL